MATLTPFTCSIRSKPALAATNEHSPWHWQPSAFTLMGSCTGTRGVRVGAQHGLGHALGWSWETGQSPGQFQPASSALLLGVSRHMSIPHELNLGFLQPSCYSHCFSNQLRGLLFLVPDPRATVPNMWSNCSCPRENLEAHLIPLLFCVPS